MIDQRLALGACTPISPHLDTPPPPTLPDPPPLPPGQKLVGGEGSWRPDPRSCRASGAQGSVAVGFSGACQLSPFLGVGGGASQRAVSTSPEVESPPTPAHRWWTVHGWWALPTEWKVHRQ